MSSFNVTIQGIQYYQVVALNWTVILALTVANNICAIILLTKVRCEDSTCSGNPVLFYCQCTCILLAISCIGALITLGPLAIWDRRRAVTNPDCFFDPRDIAVRSGRDFLAFANLVCVIFASYNSRGSRTRLLPVNRQQHRTASPHQSNHQSLFLRGPQRRSQLSPNAIIPASQDKRLDETLRQWSSKVSQNSI